MKQDDKQIFFSKYDKEIRQICGNNGYWFAPISPETGEIILCTQSVGEFRNSRARKDLKDWLERVNLPYHSPHKFRHGNAVFAIKNAKDINVLKAISQNLMHSNLSITDGVYGIFSQEDVKEKILNLHHDVLVKNINTEEIIINGIKKILEKISEGN